MTMNHKLFHLCWLCRILTMDNDGDVEHDHYDYYRGVAHVWHIPHICHEPHEYIRVNFFGPV